MNRPVRFGLVLSEAERNALAQLARAEGDLSMAATIRRLIHVTARKRGLLITDVDNRPRHCEERPTTQQSDSAKHNIEKG
jgi:hypothetical protein